MKKIILIWLLAMGYGVLVFANEVDPYALRQEALRDFDYGKSADAQNKLIRAYDLFVQAGEWDMASMCLYERAIDYMNIGDLANMAMQCDELKRLYEQYNSAIVAYNYHSVASAYYSFVDSMDLAIQHGWGAIHDVDKRLVLQEVQTKYEVEKQQLKMDKLEAENKSRGWLVIALGLLLLLLVIGYWLLVMGRKNAEAKLYEAALEADNMRQTISELESQTNVEPLRLLVDGLIKQLVSAAKRDYTEAALKGLQGLDLRQIQLLLSHGSKLTTMDKRYILCFAAGMTVEQIADFMCLEAASVYTVRYRIRKKMGSEHPFPY